MKRIVQFLSKGDIGQYIRICDIIKSNVRVSVTKILHSMTLNCISITHINIIKKDYK